MGHNREPHRKEVDKCMSFGEASGGMPPGDNGRERERERGRGRERERERSEKGY